MSVNKSIAVTERSRVSFQAQFLNAFNHPTFRGAPSGGVRSSGWGTVTSQSNANGNFGRVIEFRLNISF